VNGLFAGVPFGAAGSPGFGWGDITAIKGGVTWRLAPNWTVRAGYGHAGNPIPALQTLLNIVVTRHIAGGATWAAGKGLKVTGFVVVAPRNTVYGKGPTAFGGGEADVGLSETTAGAPLGMKS
jgi:long-chain fatty acid transport protein